MSIINNIIKRLLSRKALPFVVAAVSALIVVILINTYLKQQADVARRKAEETGKLYGVVLIAKEDIPVGKEITEDMVQERRIPNVFVQPKAADSFTRIEGYVPVAPILKGEQITLTKLSLPGQVGSLSMKTPAGKRAISVVVDNISALGGMLRPGDHVDVITVVPVPMPAPDGKQTVQLTTMPLFQDVLVLAVGSKLEREEVRSQKKTTEEKQPAQALSSFVITLALGPQEANLIAFIQEQQGKIRLILRSPTDTQTQTLAPGSWDAVIQYIYPQLMQQQQAQPEEKQKIEIYRGDKKEVK